MMVNNKLILSTLSSILIYVAINSIFNLEVFAVEEFSSLQFERQVIRKP